MSEIIENIVVNEIIELFPGLPGEQGPAGELPTDGTADEYIGGDGEVHDLNKAAVGLDQVDNTSDTDKPVSSAQQTALDGKIDDSQVLTDVPAGAQFTDTIYDDTGIQAEVDSNTSKRTYPLSDETKLSGIEEGAAADQDLTGLVLKANVLELDNTTPFTPDADYEPGTKKYSDDAISLAVTGHESSGTHFASKIITENSDDFFIGNDQEAVNAEIGDSLFDLGDDTAIHRFVTTHSVSAGVFTVTITQPDGLNLAFNISRVRVDHTSDVMSVDCTSFTGTDLNQLDIYVYVKDTAGSPELVCSNTSPEHVIEHVDALIAKVGTVSADSVTIIGSLRDPLETYEAITKMWHRLKSDGARRLSGLAYAALEDDLSIGSGNLQMAFEVRTSTAQVVGTDGLWHTNSDGTFEHKLDFSFTKYYGGEEIGNKYYCVVLGVVFGEETKIYAIVQSKPPSEHISALSAYGDSDHRSITPTDDMIGLFFIPVCYVIIKNDGDDFLQEIDSGSGEYAFPVSTVGGGGAPSVSNVANGTTDGQIAVWSNTSGEYEPKTEAEVRTLLDIRIDIGTIVSPVIDLTGAATQKCALTGAQTFSTANRSATVSRRRTVILSPVDADLTPTFHGDWGWAGDNVPPVTIADGEKWYLVLWSSGADETDILAVCEQEGDGT